MSATEMWGVQMRLLCITTICLLGLVTSKSPKDMTNNERRQFAMKTLSEVFETKKSARGELMTRFGMLKMEDLTENIKAYQRLHSIPVTGVVDDTTVEEMMLPRCGVRDMISRTKDMKRRKRYNLGGTRWDNSSPLTFWFERYSEKLPREVQRRVFVEAFMIWQNVAGIRFKEGNESNRDINIIFARREHGDGYSFDGYSNTLAHAFLPSYGMIGGDAHFDEDEDWTDKTTKGTNLLQVVVHELGHSLGLDHSTNRSAVMFPSYFHYNPNFKLHTDDIRAIQALYGPRGTAPTAMTTTTTSTTTTTTTTTTTKTTTTAAATTTTTTRPTATRPTATRPTATRPTATRPTATTTKTHLSSSTQSSDSAKYYRKQFCRDGSFDAITSFQGQTYVFKGAMYGVLSENGLLPGYPRRISEKFHGLEGVSKIDAALSWNTPKYPVLHLFSGDRYWSFDDNGLRSGYPRLINKGFRGLPKNIDAAFVWGRNGRTYIFKGTDYYKFEGTGSMARKAVLDGYPRNITIWNISQVFNKIDAAFTWQGNSHTYMFSGDQYIRYAKSNIGMDEEATPPYPRKTKDWWLMCEETSFRSFVSSESRYEQLLDVIPQACDYDDVAPYLMISDSVNTTRNSISKVIGLLVLMHLVY